LIPAVGIVGARNPLNSEGLRWLLKSRRRTVAPMKVFGGLGQDLPDDRVEWCGRHRDASEPYQQCGVILVPVALGSGVQVKLIEALAAGRAVIVRRGGARGLPAETKGWIEVDTADEMLDAANEMLVDPEALRRQAKAARGYYDAYLDSTMILERLKDVYRRLL
jgi:glycosyltransferase involved in cell wall biosynthesis